MSRQCPDCGLGLRPSANRCSCGWVDPGERQNAVRDPFYHLCENVERGQRCMAPGSLSTNLREGGPWYCRDHFPLFLEWNKARESLPAGGFAQIKSLVAKAAPILEAEIDHEAVAERAAIQGETA